MKRETVTACYYKATKPVDFGAIFISKYPDYSSAEPLCPEFTKQRLVENTPDINKSTKGVSSIDNTVTFCSTLSRVTVDKVIFQDILKSRAGHSIFTSLEKEDVKEKKWYYIDEKNGTINGPFTSIEMDERFQIHKLNEKTRVKTKEEDDYYGFSKLIQRYYKNVLKDQLDLEKDNPKLSNKIIKFKKGTAMPKNKWVRENYETKNREERVVSMLPRPQLLHLKDMLPADSDDEDESYYQRMRANTLAN